MRPPQLCNKVFTKKDFKKFLKEAVLFSPVFKVKKEVLLCKQLQSWVAMDQSNKLDLDNFGKSLFDVQQGKEVWLRNKNKKFPALVFSEVPSSYSDLFGNNPKKCCKIQIGVVEKERTDDCKNCGYCGKRNKDQIKCDLDELLINALRGYFSEIVSAIGYKYDKDGVKVYTSKTHDWVSIPVLKDLVEDGIIDGYDTHHVTTSKFKKWLKETFGNVRGLSATYKVIYHSSYIEFTFCENLTCEKVDFEVKKHKNLTEISCC